MPALLPYVTHPLRRALSSSLSIYALARMFGPQDCAIVHGSYVTDVSERLARVIWHATKVALREK